MSLYYWMAGEEKFARNLQAAIHELQYNFRRSKLVRLMVHYSAETITISFKSKMYIMHCTRKEATQLIARFDPLKNLNARRRRALAKQIVQNCWDIFEPIAIIDAGITPCASYHTPKALEHIICDFLRLLFKEKSLI